MNERIDYILMALWAPSALLLFVNDATHILPPLLWGLDGGIAGICTAVLLARVSMWTRRCRHCGHGLNQ